ncbi:hypothetical protein [Sphingomonas qomolangmaensis]|uniref:Uncharacterized protein n=1 Tax=Sphingomonas qomolangmaensis TaxID=2918765 RepID=A0ABY5LBE9_9SPHN|nr:hypothetical protein [Sphingomonas qomolangmaensis]UUL82983.1 hypothetical protein NMP03_01735 [Sphingomonas qomolangmaensis]
MTLLSAFEIVYENLVPTEVVPAGPNNPLLVQGYFIQISVIPSAFQNVNFNIVFQETTKFSQGLGQSALQAQFIDAQGNVNIFPSSQFFGSTANGFLQQSISPGQTLIYGVQCIPGLTTEKGAIPQGGTGWRGTVQINPSTSNALIATPTQRLVYYSGADIDNPVVDAVVYPVPTFNGTTLI